MARSELLGAVQIALYYYSTRYTSHDSSTFPKKTNNEEKQKEQVTRRLDLPLSTHTLSSSSSSSLRLRRFQHTIPSLTSISIRVKAKDQDQDQESKIKKGECQSQSVSQSVSHSVSHSVIILYQSRWTGPENQLVTNRHANTAPVVATQRIAPVSLRLADPPRELLLLLLHHHPVFACRCRRSYGTVLLHSATLFDSFVLPPSSSLFRKVESRKVESRKSTVESRRRVSQVERQRDRERETERTIASIQLSVLSHSIPHSLTSYFDFHSFTTPHFTLLTLRLHHILLPLATLGPLTFSSSSSTNRYLSPSLTPKHPLALLTHCHPRTAHHPQRLHPLPHLSSTP